MAGANGRAVWSNPYILETAYTIVGVAGSVLFFGRFYVQWIVAEIKKQYVVPVSFWYMSAAGSLMLFVYAFGRGSPGGTLGVCFNLIVYCRNLIHIWRERGVLTPFWNVAAHVFACVTIGIASALTFFTWRAGYSNTTEFWAWSVVWAVGQAVFFLRFLIQWAVTEIRHKSIIPASFWWLSLAGLFLHGSYFFHRGDWLLAIGTLSDGLPYVRNLWLMRRYPPAGE
ncbi:MAG TPA: lipid-A-disaccharide synthase N-terminal domain-containing protein [Candidatus Hydrogenedentes bacterium]|nr:lipid-A-disaccharide synthase N-terminal domain-containing protein [Candidatus Hydrogenedentota bacterium]